MSAPGKYAIPPVPLAEIDDPKLRRLIADAEAKGVPDDRFLRILAHVPGYAEALYEALERSHFRGNVDHRLKEIIRVQLARLAGDAYFGTLRSTPARAAGLDEQAIEAGCADFEADDRFTPAEKWALRYAWTMYRAPKTVDKAFYEEGKRHFSEAEIMELGAFIAFHYGMQLFFGTLDLPVRPTY